MAKLGYTAEQYQEALRKLLPHGPAWDDLDGSCFFMKMLTLASLEFARIDADIVRLIDESDPTTASVTLGDWFHQWGIPDECTKNTDATLEQLREVLLLKIRALGLTFAELVPIIGKICGYAETKLDTADTFTVASTVDCALYSDDWADWFWTVTVSDLNRKYFTVDGRVNEFLATWGNELFECLIKHYTPAHTGVIFKYGA